MSPSMKGFFSILFAIFCTIVPMSLKDFGINLPGVQIWLIGLILSSIAIYMGIQARKGDSPMSAKVLGLIGLIFGGIGALNYLLVILTRVF